MTVNAAPWPLRATLPFPSFVGEYTAFVFDDSRRLCSLLGRFGSVDQIAWLSSSNRESNPDGVCKQEERGVSLLLLIISAHVTSVIQALRKSISLHFEHPLLLLMEGSPPLTEL